MTSPKRDDGASAAEAAALEKLRRSGFTIDREGRFVHEGAFVEHEGLRRALFRWLDRAPDGRYVLRVDDARFAYVDVEDTPLVARSLRWGTDGQAFIALSDGREERLEPATVTCDAAGTLRCRARGRLEARFASSAAAALAERIERRGDDLVLLVGGEAVPLSAR